MQYLSTINNYRALEWQLNPAESIAFSWIYELPSWASSITIENLPYYWADKKKACDDLPNVTDKPDTMYRYFKSFFDKGLIVMKKIEGKDYIAITEKGKNWRLTGSEKNPKLGKKSELLGKISENGSENFPTYYYINSNKEIIQCKDFVEISETMKLWGFDAEKYNTEQAKDYIKDKMRIFLKLSFAEGYCFTQKSLLLFLELNHAEYLMHYNKLSNGNLESNLVGFFKFYHLNNFESFTHLDRAIKKHLSNHPVVERLEIKNTTIELDEYQLEKLRE